MGKCVQSKLVQEAPSSNFIRLIFITSKGNKSKMMFVVHTKFDKLFVKYHKRELNLYVMFSDITISRNGFPNLLSSYNKARFGICVLFKLNWMYFFNSFSGNIFDLH